MGPHALRSHPADGRAKAEAKPDLQRPMKTVEVEDQTEIKKRRGRPKKTGRPGM
jgi:excinuclease ABC subunit B